MAGIKSRVAITTDMWTSDNQKRGYMAITAHFIDESWTLRNIIMRFIYVPNPHTADVISEELYDALVEWNLDDKVSTVTLDNCTTNDAVIALLVRKIGKSKLINDEKFKTMDNLLAFGLVSKTFKKAFRSLNFDSRTQVVLWKCCARNLLSTTNYLCILFWL
ncbi:hypothetical protein E2562_006468 [Oryza meyeriana var. granulata]|uniref:hAT-like transposase RNase-H fold domain-containing protein n=1 Tax=Oryza meyeriana var. granulata TaxID=110450 RepID=A0A6G1CP50_9ORYZ|nr:hypothetical protein E2562_006468 [Oryza meyeriana var. granulata]